MNRALRLTNPAIINIANCILNAPALIVKSLKGIGVNPAVKIIIKLYWSYKDLIFEKASVVKPGMYWKKKFANDENSLGADHHIHDPIPYPIAAPIMEKMLHNIAK
mgnify:CR=1 FL=1